MSAAEPAPEIEAVLTIKLRGPLATIEAVSELSASLDEWMAERYPERYAGLSVKLDVEMPGPLPSPADLAYAERVARDQGIIP